MMTTSSVRIITYLPVLKAHVNNFPQNEVSNSDCGNKLMLLGADMSLVYYFFLRSSLESRDFRREALFLCITFDLAARSKAENAFFKAAGLGDLRTAKTAFRKAVLIWALTTSFLLIGLTLFIVNLKIRIRKFMLAEF